MRFLHKNELNVLIATKIVKLRLLAWKIWGETAIASSVRPVLPSAVS
jgi:hypothetical protein